MDEQSAVTVASTVAQVIQVQPDNGIPMWVFYVALAVIGALIVAMLYFANRDKDSPEFAVWKFVATKGKNGNYFPDITKLGQWHGIIAASWVAIALAAKIEHLTPGEYTIILIVCLLYLAGVQMFQAVMKARGAVPAQAEAPKEEVKS